MNDTPGAAPNPPAHDKSAVFGMDFSGGVVVVEPLGDESSFRYFDIHNQANRVMRRLDNPDVRAVVIDLRSVPALGWVMTSAIVRLVRNLDYRGGLAVYCSATDSVLVQLSAMKLGTPWSHHANREEAVVAVQAMLPGGGAELSSGGDDAAERSQ